MVSPVERPDLALPATLGQGSAATAQQAPVASDWWTRFSDPSLNALINAGLEQNFSLQASWARLAQSRALWRQAGADQYPDLNLSLSKNRKWQEDVTSGSWSAGLSTEYELDFWGRVSALDDKARLAALSSAASVRTQANTVAAQIALNWYGLIMAQDNLQLLASQQKRLSESLAVTQGRFQRGQVSISDVWQQQQQLEANQAERIAAEASRDGYRQQLALWTGNAAGFDLSADSITTQVLPELNVSNEAVAVSVLGERPDVQAAWLEVEAANAGLAAAIANRYPRLTLTASYSGSDEDLSQVFDNWVANLAGSLVLPLIDGGNRRAAVAQNRAVLDEALAAYQQTLLEAALEVQQALLDEKEAAASLDSLNRQLELARKTEAFQDNRYRKGVGDFLSLLNARESVLSLEQKVLSARWTQVQARIQLFRAVSHGDFLHKEPSA
ncbi:efflux transporter outer membrane subunit [Thalassolituus sp. LLYu03]|uniref:efflux transporter outer membrane subunit n=1 Tax=Thalassolituus sp. LLYu03 TaxID=3421656 RepID=UPI003D28FAD6